MIPIQAKQNQTEDFDAIAFELEKEQIFDQAEEQKFRYYSDDFSSGAWDAILGNQPTDDQIMSADYRSGYVSGTQEKLNKRLIELQQFAA